MACSICTSWVTICHLPCVFTVDEASPWVSEGAYGVGAANSARASATTSLICLLTSAAISRALSYTNTPPLMSVLATGRMPASTAGTTRGVKTTTAAPISSTGSNDSPKPSARLSHTAIDRLLLRQVCVMQGTLCIEGSSREKQGSFKFFTDY